MRACVVIAAVLAASMGLSCGHHRQPENIDAPGSAGPDACSDPLLCNLVACAQKSLPPTTITGTVYAPNGTLPLFGVNVYVPDTDPGPMPSGLVCDRCSDGLPGNPVAITQTDEAGHFTLENVPATTNVPLVITSGKWRRQLVLPNVAACQVLEIGSADTSLPKSYADATPLTALDASNKPKVDMPKIAISTGNADALECLPIKLGIDPTEITNDQGPGHVHLYTNSHTGTNNPGQGAAKFQPNWPGSVTTAGDPFGDSTVMWADTTHLDAYDIVMLSCEGGQYPATKPQTALVALHDYADAGGRVFMSHWHNIWIGGEIGNGSAHGIPEWEAIANWNFNAAQNDPNQRATIDETVPKGSNFAKWMVDNGGSLVRDIVEVNQPRYTLGSADSSKTSRLVWVDPANEYPACGSGQTSNCSKPFPETSIQDLEFTTPVGATPDAVCGKVVFSDMHVSSGSTSSPAVPYPDLPAAPGTSACSGSGLSPQEKALSFIFFDIASCVSVFQ
jgi:hypothetical protein